MDMYPCLKLVCTSMQICRHCLHKRSHVIHRYFNSESILLYIVPYVRAHTLSLTIIIQWVHLFYDVCPVDNAYMHDGLFCHCFDSLSYYRVYSSTVLPLVMLNILLYAWTQPGYKLLHMYIAISLDSKNRLIHLRMLSIQVAWLFVSASSMCGKCFTFEVARQFVCNMQVLKLPLNQFLTTSEVSLSEPIR